MKVEDSNQDTVIMDTVNISWPEVTDGISSFSTNVTAASIDYDLYQKYQKNRSVSDTAYWLILISYSVLIVAGSLGNLFVVFAVASNKGK